MVGLTSILKEAWNTAQQTGDKREKLQALSLTKECYSMKFDLLSNATVVDDAIRFISQSKEKPQPLDSSKEDDKESRDPHYDEDRDQIEEEQGNRRTNGIHAILAKLTWKSLRYSYEYVI